MLLPPKPQLTVCFAHRAYRLAERFELRNTGIGYVQARSPDDLLHQLREADVLVVSMLWNNAFAKDMPRLKFIQSISAGVDYYDQDVLRAQGIRLASAAGVNAEAVAEHAMALTLALYRKLPEARDNQTARHWRGMISDISSREDQLTGKTMLIVGLGRIGARLAKLAKAFDMQVLAVRRDPTAGPGPADAVFAQDKLHEVIGRADVVALTCPLTPETENLIDARALAAMRPTAYLINVARGRVVDETALVTALQERRISGAGLDVVVDEPLPADSPLWSMPNVLITPHTAGETQRYEDAVIDILLENLDRLWRGETTLKNQVV